MTTSLERAKVFRANGGVCYLCDRKIAPGEKWEVEHIKAKGLGGSNDPDNLRPAHIDCHAGKTRRDVAIMRKADRQGKKHLGIKRRKGPPMPGTKASGWKKRIDGTVERRSG